MGRRGGLFFHRRKLPLLIRGDVLFFPFFCYCSSQKRQEDVAVRDFCPPGERLLYPDAKESPPFSFPLVIPEGDTPFHGLGRSCRYLDSRVQQLFVPPFLDKHPPGKCAEELLFLPGELPSDCLIEPGSTDLFRDPLFFFGLSWQDAPRRDRISLPCRPANMIRSRSFFFY